MNEQEDQQAQGAEALTDDPRCREAIDAAANALVASVMRSGGKVPTANEMRPLFARLWCLGYQDCIADEAKRNHTAWMRAIERLAGSFDGIIPDEAIILRPYINEVRPSFQADPPEPERWRVGDSFTTQVDTSQPILSVEEWNLLRRSTLIGPDSSA